jgi:hypothetical protein
MAATIRRAACGVAALAFVSVLTSAQDSRIALFDAYNSARTYEQVQPLVSGLLAQQYAAVAKRNPQQIPTVLAQQQLASYRARIVDIDALSSFLVLEQVATKTGSNTSSQAYLVTKTTAGSWTLANRMMTDSVIKALWTRQFNPSDFAQPASCTIDGREFVTRSALAIRRGRTIEVKLYPFEFSAADLSYWRQMSGLPPDALASESHFNQRIPTVCRAIVTMDAGGPALLNVGFDDSSSGTGRSALWPPAKTDAAHLAIQQDMLELTTAGALGPDRSGFRWNVNIKIPIWQQGL